MYSGCFDVRGQFQNFGFSGLSMWRSAASSISACGESQTGHILTINQGATRGKYAPVCESASDVSSNHDFVSAGFGRDRKSTRLNSSHGYISYAVFCLKKKNK